MVNAQKLYPKIVKRKELFLPLEKQNILKPFFFSEDRFFSGISFGRCVSENLGPKNIWGPVKETYPLCMYHYMLYTVKKKTKTQKKTIERGEKLIILLYN